jgi:hypothetical protein
VLASAVQDLAPGRTDDGSTTDVSDPCWSDRPDAAGILIDGFRLLDGGQDTALAAHDQTLRRSAT